MSKLEFVYMLFDPKCILKSLLKPSGLFYYLFPWHIKCLSQVCIKRFPCLKLRLVCLPKLSPIPCIGSAVNDVCCHVPRLIEVAQTTAGECPSSALLSDGLLH